MRFVHVIGDGALVRALSSLDRAERLEERRSLAALALLDHVRSHALDAGVDADTVSFEGEPAACVLATARDWRADLIVLGRSDVPGMGRPYVGSVTRNVLEFSECPVLVVPRPE
jgi:nucleotide-binding universal stress UspA family protein